MDNYTDIMELWKNQAAGRSAKCYKVVRKISVYKAVKS